MHIQKHPNQYTQWDSVEIFETNQTNITKRKLFEAIHIQRHESEIKRDTGLFIPNAYNYLIRMVNDKTGF